MNHHYLFNSFGVCNPELEKIFLSLDEQIEDVFVLYLDCAFEIFINKSLKILIMKKFLLFSALISTSFLANAQTADYKAFKVDVGLGYAIPSSGNGSGIKAGATFTIEPHYRLSDVLAVGLRLEGAALGYQESTGTGTKTQVSVLNSYCPSIEYYFTKEGFRPFGGVGAGIFSQKSLASSNGNATFLAGGSSFGFFPRLGFETGHFRMAANYNVVGNNSSYASFSIGAFFGGGKK